MVLKNVILQVTMVNKLEEINYSLNFQFFMHITWCLYQFHTIYYVRVNALRGVPCVVTNGL